MRIWVIVRFAGLPEGVFRLANSGRYFATGSATLSLPSSCSMSTATPVTGLVIDAIQNSVSGVIGTFRRDIGETGGFEVQDLVFRDDDGDGAGDFVFRDHLLHRRADTGELWSLLGSVRSWAKAVSVAESARTTARRQVSWQRDVSVLFSGRQVWSTVFVVVSFGRATDNTDNTDAIRVPSR